MYVCIMHIYIQPKWVFKKRMYQSVVGGMAYAAFLGCELLIEIIKNTLWAQMVVICHDIDELDESINTREITELEIKMRLRYILVKVNDSNRYSKDFRNLFYWKFFLQPVLSSCAFGLAMFLFIVVNQLFFVYRRSRCCFSLISFEGRVVVWPSVCVRELRIRCDCL